MNSILDSLFKVILILKSHELKSWRKSQIVDRLLLFYIISPIEANRPIFDFCRKTLFIDLTSWELCEREKFSLAWIEEFWLLIFLVDVSGVLENSSACLKRGHLLLVGVNKSSLQGWIKDIYLCALFLQRIINVIFPLKQTKSPVNPLSHIQLPLCNFPHCHLFALHNYRRSNMILQAFSSWLFKHLFRSK